MILIPDDPIIKSMEGSGFPPWMDDEQAEEIDRIL